MAKQNRQQLKLVGWPGAGFILVYLKKLDATCPTFLFLGFSAAVVATGLFSGN